MSDLILLATKKGTLILDRKNGRWTPRPIAHEPALQTLTRQLLGGGGGQFASMMQPTQLPPPSHIRVPPQLMPAETFGFCGTPSMHWSSVHGLPST